MFLYELDADVFVRNSRVFIADLRCQEFWRACSWCCEGKNAVDRVCVELHEWSAMDCTARSTSIEFQETVSPRLSCTSGNRLVSRELAYCDTILLSTELVLETVGVEYVGLEKSHKWNM